MGVSAFAAYKHAFADLKCAVMPRLGVKNHDFDVLLPRLAPAYGVQHSALAIRAFYLYGDAHVSVFWRGGQARILEAFRKL